MWTIASGDTKGLLDCGEFLVTVNALRRHSDPEAGSLFRGEDEITVSRAPGRLDVMGGIADYSGSLVLQLPLAAATFVAAQPRADRQFRVVSLRDGTPCSTSVDFLRLLRGYSVARQLFEEGDIWAAYVLGIIAVWSEELGFVPDRGADVAISSDVPEGAGVASSAALEVASAQALANVYGVRRTPVELALDCQRVENLVVGAPCGVMDQMTSQCGEAGRLLKLLCQPAEIQGHLAIPPELSVWGIHSGVSHSVAGADYEQVRVAAFMGHRILAESVGCRVEKVGGSIRIPNDPWIGYLANIPAARFKKLAKQLPKEITGSAFLQKYHGTIDTATSVDPRRVYPVRAATTHPVHENLRIHAFAEQLERIEEAGSPAFLGRLMHESHDSYSACGLGSPETDLLVRLARREKAGIYGAKITGGGSGGTVAILGQEDAGEVVNRIASKYEERSRREARILSGSSMGASLFGIMRLRRA